MKVIFGCKTCSNERYVTCDYCDGTGGYIETEDSWMEQCPECYEGKVECYHCNHAEVI